jgi:hypothetical protein
LAEGRKGKYKLSPAIREKSSTSQLLIGTALAEAGAALVGCGEWDVLKTGTPLLFYTAGFIVLAAGMFLIWKEPLSAMIVENGAPGETSGRRKFLGRIDLNGYYFEAYEDESNCDGKRFRLQSFPTMNPEHEAAFVRYLVREGFIEKRWPRLSGKIRREAGWAFFF